MTWTDLVMEEAVIWIEDAKGPIVAMMKMTRMTMTAVAQDAWMDDVHAEAPAAAVVTTITVTRYTDVDQVMDTTIMDVMMMIAMAEDASMMMTISTGARVMEIMVATTGTETVLLMKIKRGDVVRGTTTVQSMKMMNITRTAVATAQLVVPSGAVSSDSSNLVSRTWKGDTLTTKFSFFFF